MPFGAHESMETHEMLEAKICMIDHFSFYASQCQDETLRNLIQNHLQRVMQSYNQLLTYTHSYQVAKPMMNQQASNVSPNQIQYGLRSPQQVAPQTNVQYFNDRQIAGAILSAHKNSSKNHMAAALECADPNVRQMMMNGAVECCNMAYETFLYMNQKGYYQVPTLDSHTAKTMLHHYQPMNAMPHAGNQMNMPMNASQGMPHSIPMNPNYQ
ncbi:spore coat protein [Fodinisporobacter ferrooxydans]|uniref:Spore coat protein n=1 Tax=Fodinisporobacter ferrooxydans TaxID=2901836 RepID=A0ABY4CPF7_9BACL|nr:spore coat protein [Alicyclobacillaceae bacterium MYW30-H2]